MFFDGHYAGWWKHGDQGGHLFGVIRQAAGQLSKPDSVESGLK
jgi:hypothetical protein